MAQGTWGLCAGGGGVGLGDHTLTLHALSIQILCMLMTPPSVPPTPGPGGEGRAKEEGRQEGAARARSLGGRPPSHQPFPLRPPRRCGARALARRSTSIPQTISLRVSSRLISFPLQPAFPDLVYLRRMVPIDHSPPYVPCTSPSSASSLRARSCCAGKRHLLQYRPNSPGALRPAPGFEPRGCM